MSEVDSTISPEQTELERSKETWLIEYQQHDLEKELSARKQIVAKAAFAIAFGFSLFIGLSNVLTPLTIFGATAFITTLLIDAGSEQDLFLESNVI